MMHTRTARQRACIALLAFIVSGGLSTPTFADPPLEGGAFVATVHACESAPVIDGRLDEACWRDAEPIGSLIQVTPDEGAPPSEETEVRIMRDRAFLYIGVRCHDRSAEGVIASQLKRDGSLATDDHVRILIDPFFDRRNAYFFEVNPLGAKGDALIEDNSRFRKDWDGIWTARAVIDEGGWSCEFAIPIKTIGFDPGATRWSFNIARFLRRNNETSRWATPSQDISFNSVADAGELTPVEGFEETLSLDFKPYGISTLKRDHNEDTNGVDVDAGFDVFYRPIPTLTFSATVNTDFAETEVDNRRVNLTRFPLFFPEKRDFFLQDAGIFNFGGINQNPLPFQSRRIGLGPSGETIDILAGLKLTGRVKNVNVGLLDVQMKHDDELGDKNLFVGRASVNVLEQSTIGAIFTAGDPRTPGENYLGGLDFNFRSSDLEDGRTIQSHLWMQRSHTPGATGGEWAYGGKLIYPNDRVNWSVGYTEIQRNFNAALGFVPRRAIREYFGNYRYRWRPDDGPFRRIDSRVGMFLVTDLQNDVESQSLSLDLLTMEFDSGDTIDFSWSKQREVLDAPFEISRGVVLPADDYRFDRYSARVSTSTGRPVNASFRFRGGTFYSGDRTDYITSIAWRTSPYLHLGADYEINDIDLDEGDFITRIIRGRVNVFFSPDISWTTFAQYDSVSDSIGINSRVRWIVEPGNEFFVVLNQAIDRDESSYRVERTELTTKIGWTFRF